ncbi:MAG: flagellar biosynthesis repressor FlbT [Hyphomicrobiaceae bacterium]|nr:flagellar biosynthesis repressor FlbT [Hyphomicrobiaceae bacterium]
MRIHLKPKERIFINGAVIRVDRKVTLELLNEVVFLLEGHVLQEEDATTPLRQLYFVVQSMLMEPKTRPLAMQIYHSQHLQLIAAYKDRDILEGLVEIRSMIEAERPFDAMKRIRSLYPIEALLMGTAQAPADSAAVA